MEKIERKLYGTIFTIFGLINFIIYGGILLSGTKYEFTGIMEFGAIFSAIFCIIGVFMMMYNLEWE